MYCGHVGDGMWPTSVPLLHAHWLSSILCGTRKPKLKDKCKLEMVRTCGGGRERLIKVMLREVAN